MKLIETAIDILKEQKASMLELGRTRIEETGRGDLFFDGQVLGLAYAIGVLEELNNGNVQVDENQTPDLANGV